MHQRVLSGLLAILAVAPTGVAFAQEAPKAVAPAATPAVRGPSPAVLKQVVATVNGEPITRGELIIFLSNFPLPPGEEKDTYRVGIEYLANNKLLGQFVKRQRVTVSDAEVTAKFAETERKVKAEQNRDLKLILAEGNSTIEEFRSQLAWQLGWDKYIKAVATDAALKKYVDDNKDLFSRSQVRASHILLLVAPDAPATAKEAAKQKLIGIKQQIEAGKISFADAANKYSEDDANKATPNGGDLGYFTRKGQFIEKFAATAFGMKKGQISDPVETEFGLHLVDVTDRKPGVAFDFEQNRTAVLNQFVADLQERIIINERKTAKIDVKPMPADFFPAAPASTTPAATTKPAEPAK